MHYLLVLLVVNADFLSFGEGLSECCVVGRSSVSGRICHGGHRSRWHLSGHPGQRRRAAGGREEEHPQTSG